MPQEKIERAKRETEAIAASGSVDAVSFYGNYYSFVSSLNLPEHIVLLSWLNERSWYEVLLLKKYAAIRNDERVKVILVKDLGHYSR